MSVPSPPAAGTRSSFPRLPAQLPVGVFSASVPVPSVLSPRIDASARTTTTVHDGQHSIAHFVNDAPTYSSSGPAHAPGKASGTRIVSDTTDPTPFTASGVPLSSTSPLSGAGSPTRHRTRSALLAARREASRAPVSYDLVGEGTVSQSSYFWSSKFDTNADGVLCSAERAEAARLMHDEAGRYVFIKTGGPTTDMSHRIVQVNGAILCEQLEGSAALSRAKLPGHEGPRSMLHGTGAHLPPSVQDAVAEGLLVGTEGMQRTRGLLVVDPAAQGSVAMMHANDLVFDHDRIEIKPSHRASQRASGSVLRSELLAKTKAARRPDLSYDIDGDGAVSASDFFFASRQDPRGTQRLTPAARAAAAKEMAGNKFTFLSTSGTSENRVQQLEGLILEEGSSTGWVELAATRAAAAESRRAERGGEGSPRAATDVVEGGGSHNSTAPPAAVLGSSAPLHLGYTFAPSDAHAATGVDPTAAAVAANLAASTAALASTISHEPLPTLGADGLSASGRGALAATAGAVDDYDGISIKPNFRPAVLTARTRTELRRQRRRDTRPHGSYDITGEAQGQGAAVGEEEFKRAHAADGGLKGFLTPDEREVAGAALTIDHANAPSERKAGLVTEEHYVAPQPSIRTFDRAYYTESMRRNGVITSGAGGVTSVGALSRSATAPALYDSSRFVLTGVPRAPGGSYDAFARLSTIGAVPGLDLPPAIASGTSYGPMPLAGRDAIALAASTGPVVVPSMGVVPGVSRVVVRHPDGSQEAYGGYARGLAAGGPTNVMAPPIVASVTHLGDTSPGATRVLAATAELSSTAAIPYDAAPPTEPQLSPRPTASLYPEAPFRTHNMSTFMDTAHPTDMTRRAPFASMGVGGSADGMAGQPEMIAQRSTAATLGLFTKRQLRAARKPRGFSGMPGSGSGAIAGSTVGIGGLGHTASTIGLSTLASATATASAPAPLSSSFPLPATAGRPSSPSLAPLVAAATALPFETTLSMQQSEGDVLRTSTRGGLISAPHPATAASIAALDRALSSTRRSLSTLGATARGGGGLTPRAGSMVAASAMPPELPVHSVNASEWAATLAARAVDASLSATGAPSDAYAPTMLPAYMARSMSAALLVPTDPHELPHDTIKPGALDDTVRTAEAGARTALLASRQRAAKVAALTDARGDLDRGGDYTVALPALYEAGFNDHLAHDKALITLGHDRLSKTRTQLLRVRSGQRISEALPDAPDHVPTVHRNLHAGLGGSVGQIAMPVPSFAEKHATDGQPWYRDTDHLDAGSGEPPALGSPWYRGAGGATWRDVVSPLEGPAPDTDATIAGLPDNYDPIPPQYDAALRHTVRATAQNGQRVEAATLSMTAREHAPARLSGRSPRAIQDGVNREVESVDAAGGDMLKLRDVSHTALGRWQRRHGDLTNKVGVLTPQVARAPAFVGTAPNHSLEAGAAAGGGGGASYEGLSPGSSPPLPLHALHRNASAPGTCLPGAMPHDAAAALRTSLLASPIRPPGMRWSSAVVEHTQRLEDVAHDMLAADGKEARMDRHANDPLYSSFTPDGVFAVPYVAPRGRPQPSSPSRNANAAAAAGGPDRLTTAGSLRLPTFSSLPGGGTPGPSHVLPPLAPPLDDRPFHDANTYGVAVLTDGTHVQVGSSAGGAPVADSASRGSARAHAKAARTPDSRSLRSPAPVLRLTESLLVAERGSSGGGGVRTGGLLKGS